jgi:copper/silver efflux system protein
VLAIVSAVALSRKIGQEFMPALNEGDSLYMPITFPNISIEEAERQLQIQDRILKSFPEVDSVFGKVGRADANGSCAADHGRNHRSSQTARTVARVKTPRWYSSWAPDP